jgi:hypothetical protein
MPFVSCGEITQDEALLDYAYAELLEAQASRSRPSLHDRPADSDFEACGERPRE